MTARRIYLLNAVILILGWVIVPVTTAWAVG